MKIKSFISLFAAGLILASCSHDKGDAPDVTPTNEKAIVRVTVDATSFSTRASFPDNKPTPQEVPLYNYAILVFNQNQILEHIEAVPIGNRNDPPKDPTQETLTSEFEVTLGAKFFYVVANVPVSELMSNQDQFSPDQNVLVQGIKDYVLELDEVDQIIGYLKSGSVANPNLKNRGFMMSTLKGLQTEMINIRKEDGTNHVTLELGRAMAKVAVRDNLLASTQDGLYGTLENISYKVGHNPKKMYVVQHYHRDASNVLITPNYEDETVDANAYFGPVDDYQSADDAANTFTYCLENANKIPKEGNATVVYIKGKFVPNDQHIADGTQSDLQGGTFWRIKNTDPDNPIKYQPGFYANEPTPGANEEAVKYEGGICYYTLYLADKDAADKYTVKRNSFYKVTIDKVSNAGEPTDDEEELIPEPETPLDGSGLVKATITIARWHDINQGGEI